MTATLNFVACNVEVSMAPMSRTGPILLGPAPARGSDRPVKIVSCLRAVGAASMVWGPPSLANGVADGASALGLEALDEARGVVWALTGDFRGDLRLTGVTVAFGGVPMCSLTSING